MIHAGAQTGAILHGIRIAAVVAAVLVAHVILRRFLPAALRHGLGSGADDALYTERLRRAETLAHAIITTSMVVLFVVGFFLILAEFGFNVAPVVAGVGITGVALGLGAQTLVRDAINGVFILGENQFGRGDIVTLANVSGRVEDVNLRRTLLRAEDGTLYVVPNSTIGVAANHTRGYSGISFTVAISYSANLDAAIREIDRIGRDLADDAELGQRVLEPPHADRIDSLEDAYLNLHVAGKAAPGAGLRVSSEMRRRIIAEFDRLGIAYRGGPVARPEEP